MRRPRGKQAVAALALCVIAVAAVARAQGRFVGLQVTPARFERDLPTRDFRISVQVVNNDPIAHEVALSVARLGHSLNGTPLFIEPSYVERSVSLSDEVLSLAPGGRATVVVDGAIPAGDGSIYPAVVAEFAGRSDPQIDVRARVAGFLMLRGPKPWIESVAVESVHALPPEGRRSRLVTLYADIRNTGNVHVAPRGVIDVVQDGELLDRVKLEGETIIPEFARRLVGSWTPPRDLSGTVELRARIKNPTASGSGTLRLGPDLAIGAIQNLIASGTGGGRVSLFVVNTGTSPFMPTVELEAQGDDVPGATHERQEDELAPGEAREVVWRPGLDPGLYTVTVRLRQEDRLLDESVTAFEVVSTGILVWVALALLIAVVVAHALRVWRRRSLF